MRKANINTIKKNVRNHFPTLEVTSDRFKTYVTLLASAQVGPNIKRVAKFTGYTRNFIANKARNLRANNIWVDDTVRGNWDNPKYGYIELKLDAAAANDTCNRSEKWRKVLY